LLVVVGSQGSSSAKSELSLLAERSGTSASSVRGLCELCAEKWVPGHKCQPTMQLQVIEEVWDMLEEETPVETIEEVPEPTLMALSMAS
jgi:hypothetical protein